jgi:hypothetical protein
MKRILAFCAALVVLATAGVGSSSPSRQHGFLLGAQMQPRKVAQLTYAAGIHDIYELERSSAIMLAESQGYTRAYNDNVDASGKVISRDVGLYEINIPASQIGTSVEEALYDPANNVAAMKKLYDARGWQPWVAYTSGVYLHDTYIRRASLALMNLVAEKLVRDAQALGQSPQTPVPMLSQKQLSHFLALYP